MATREKVELRAYRIWHEAGCPQGSSLAHWLQAEIELGIVPDPEASAVVGQLAEAADDALQNSVDQAVPTDERLPRAADENPLSQHVENVGRGRKPRPGATTFEGGDQVARTHREPPRPGRLGGRA